MVPASGLSTRLVEVRDAVLVSSLIDLCQQAELSIAYNGRIPLCGGSKSCHQQELHSSQLEAPSNAYFGDYLEYLLPFLHVYRRACPLHPSLRL